jgi:hypothetical protein
MDKSESRKENRNGEKRRFDPDLLKKGLRCDLDQYEMLKRCSDKKDVSEWNEYCEKHLYEKIWLQGAYLVNANLQGARLIGADFRRANLANAILMKAQVWEANLQGANLDMVNLESSNLQRANLQGAFIPLANLVGAQLVQTNLQDAKFRESNLIGANFEIAVVDGGTLLWKCKVNRYFKENKRFTNFEGVGLGSARIDPGTKQLLEYNIRRKNWQKWYWGQPDEKIWWLDTPRKKQLRVIRAIPRLVFTFPVRWFWWVSNYGISAPRIIEVFLVLAVAFASVYYLWGMIAPPGVLDYLFVDGNGVKVAWWLVPIRAIHFSVVVMTVGFTNMHANAHSFWAHILVSLQMILGFVLLGALVTRFAVLFTAGGPAGKFADEKEKATEDRGQRTEDRGRRTEDRGRR